ncbi:MAG: putative membrane protein involved in D-alanine export [Parcubacteria group bacterium Licking1014_1]|nr:MAG: putative membrane protein involved in D-alanine export [Parcubacteria group bacterium Licking1014_1]
MLFNSIEFLIFFPSVVSLYFLTPQRRRWLLLLLASCFFYMAFIPAYILILAALIIIDYFSAILISNSTGRKRKIFLIISIFFTCFALFIFKYYNFFNINFESIAYFLRWNYSLKALNLIIPIGLSFHTFQSLSYVIEVYRGKYKAERNFGIYALYVMFFPQLAAGPIERPQNLIHQFYEKHEFEYQRVVGGLKLMALGLFKKMVIADRLALFVNQVYSNPTDYSGLGLIAATVFFAFQIYYDFSGYSDIAIGAAQVMGFRLMDNFNHPYMSRSISEFWRRWHISLSTWFRDYLYIPLGGSRVKISRRCFNLFITFLVGGLWHGANWTFMAWGALNGFYYVFGIITAGIRKKIVELTHLNKLPKFHKYIQIFTTFCLTCFGWIFFRAGNIKDAFYIISRLFVGIPVDLVNSIKFLQSVKIQHSIILGQPVYELFVLIASFVFMMILYYAQKNKSDKNLFSDRPLLIRWVFYYILVFGIIFLSISGEMKFIYFQF